MANMSGAKIFVLHKKDLIRIGVIVLVALALVIAALVFFVPGRRTEEPSALYTPGTYSSTIVLNDEPFHVRVTVSENEILSVYMTDMGEVQKVFYPLFEPQMNDLAEEILRYQSAHIVQQTDYPVTTGILHDAVHSALELAANGP
jgi:hypothetical protein